MKCWQVRLDDAVHAENINESSLQNQEGSKASTSPMYLLFWFMMMYSNPERG